MGEAAKKDDEEKLVPVGPGAEELNEAEKEKEEPQDSRLAQSDEADEPEAEGATGERRRESAKDRRARLKKQHARERLERDFLLKRNEDLEKRLMVIEGRTVQNETAAIDQRITSITAQVTNAERVLTEALRKPNGAGAEEFAEALRIRDELREQLHTLKGVKSRRDVEVVNDEHSGADARRSTRAPEVKPDPRVIRNAREWAGDHEWFDFNGEDEDSRIVRQLDEVLSAEGYDPTSKEYWDELTARVKRRLPERFRKGARTRDEEDDDGMEDEDEKPRGNAGPKFSSGGRERPLRKGEVYVSAERKQAMKEYGVWDDPVARNRMLKKYAQWDAETAAQNKSR